MTEREKIAHLLRRFGLGASVSELDALEPKGVRGALDHLLDYETVNEGFSPSPWAFCFEEKNPGQVYLEAPRFLGWWCLRMVMTRRPLQEKLTLFWHDHFAISAAKVEFGPMMLRYLDTLRNHASGSFVELLQAVSKEPAMLRWLDGDTNVKGAPNENFARELLELFTLGIGTYTEKDVQEAARAFTGWAWLPRIQFDKPLEPQVRALVEKGQPLVSFAVVPDLQDRGTKTVLGKTGAFDGDELLTMLAGRPETARHVTGKLWEFFAGIPASPSLRDSLARAFMDTGGDIRAVLRAVAAAPEFWSEACIRHEVKSPVDFTIPVFRQIDVQPILLTLMNAPEEPTKPIREELRGVGGGAAGAMFQQGMLLLYPPDVAGWDWGTRWISSQSMLERIKLAELLFGSAEEPKPTSSLVAQRLLQRGKAASAETMVDGLIEMFDAPLPASTRATLVKACQDHGGPGSLADPKQASALLGAVLRLMFAAPEFQFC
ncbi:MAG: DUF1800 domain-containing protein [Fimbriimonadaceae bacterium]|nr:DUF1800 domain-containing protein [Fimbriimonadaceae bacterium]